MPREPPSSGAARAGACCGVGKRLGRKGAASVAAAACREPTIWPPAILNSFVEFRPLIGSGWEPWLFFPPAGAYSWFRPSPDCFSNLSSEAGRWCRIVANRVADPHQGPRGVQPVALELRDVGQLVAQVQWKRPPADHDDADVQERTARPRTVAFCRVACRSVVTLVLCLYGGYHSLHRADGPSSFQRSRMRNPCANDLRGSSSEVTRGEDAVIAGDGGEPSGDPVNQALGALTSSARR
jgi:hypothetical protein